MLGNFKYQCVYNYPVFIGRTIEEQAVLIGAKIMIFFKILANLRIILGFLANFIKNLVLHLLALIVLKREIRYADSIGAEYR